MKDLEGMVSKIKKPLPVSPKKAQVYKLDQEHCAEEKVNGSFLVRAIGSQKRVVTGISDGTGDYGSYD